MFDKALRKMITAFEDRAQALYGQELSGQDLSASLSGNNSSNANSAA